MRQSLVCHLVLQANWPGLAGILLCPAPILLLKCRDVGVFCWIWFYVGSRDLNFVPQALYPLSYLPGPPSFQYSLLIYLTFTVLVCNDLEIK